MRHAAQGLSKDGDVPVLGVLSTSLPVLERQAVLPSVLLERTVRSYGALVVEKKIELEIQSEPGLPPLSLDPDRMAQVFGNLITNALRYTPEGGRIRLTAGRAG